MDVYDTLTEEHRAYFNERGAYIDTRADRLVMEHKQVQLWDGRWQPLTRLWESKMFFDDPISAYVYGEVSNWGR